MVGHLRITEVEDVKTFFAIFHNFMSLPEIYIQWLEALLALVHEADLIRLMYTSCYTYSPTWVVYCCDNNYSGIPLMSAGI